MVYNIIILHLCVMTVNEFSIKYSKKPNYSHISYIIRTLCG